MNLRNYLFPSIIIFFINTNIVWADTYNYYPKHLTGAWQMTLSITPDPNLSFLPEKITVLGNFTRGGEFISSIDLPTLNVPLPNGVTLPLKVGSGHGIWTKNSYNDFTLETKRIVQLATPPETLFGFGIGTAEVFFDNDRNTLSGEVVLQFSTTDGAALPPAFGELTGIRLFVGN